MKIRVWMIWGILGVMLAGALGLGSEAGMVWAAEEEETTGVNVQEVPSRTEVAEDEGERGTSSRNEGEEDEGERGTSSRNEGEEEATGEGGGGGTGATIDGDLCNDPEISKELKEAAGCGTNQTLAPVVTGVIQIVLGLVGIMAVVVMVYGGFTYVTSTGNPAKTTKARNILLYGIVGVVVAGLAYAIVYFVSKALES